MSGPIRRAAAPRLLRPDDTGRVSISPCSSCSSCSSSCLSSCCYCSSCCCCSSSSSCSASSSCSSSSSSSSSSPHRRSHPHPRPPSPSRYYCDTTFCESDECPHAGHCDLTCAFCTPSDHASAMAGPGLIDGAGHGATLPACVPTAFVSKTVTFLMRACRTRRGERWPRRASSSSSSS